MRPMSRAARPVLPQPEDDGIPFGAPDVELAPVQRYNQISGRLAAQPITLLKSAAFRVLNNAERKMFTRIEIEYSDHGGRDNGKLPVTFDQFEEYGIRRQLVAPSRRALVALGIITFEQGHAAEAAGERRPNLFGLTHRPVGEAEPANDWRRVSDDIAEAERVATAARNTLDDGGSRRRRIGAPMLRVIPGGRG
jgi:hypothetical protein